MAIKVGDPIPQITFKVVDQNGQREATRDELFAGKKVVLFAVPGAFTPLCSAQHLPGFAEQAAAIRAKGVDAIYCLSVNDAFVMDAWAKERGVEGAVTMLADGSGEFTSAVGLEMDATQFGMGKRSQRYAAVVDDGVLSHLAVEAPKQFEVSSAEAILKAL